MPSSLATLDLDLLRCFVLIAEAGNFSRAAGRLNLTQSAVSLQLKRLEDRLERRLFERTPRSVRLTLAARRCCRRRNPCSPCMTASSRGLPSRELSERSDSAPRKISRPRICRAFWHVSRQRIGRGARSHLRPHAQPARPVSFRRIRPRSGEARNLDRGWGARMARTAGLGRQARNAARSAGGPAARRFARALRLP